MINNKCEKRYKKVLKIIFKLNSIIHYGVDALLTGTLVVRGYDWQRFLGLSLGSFRLAFTGRCEAFVANDLLVGVVLFRTL